MLGTAAVDGGRVVRTAASAAAAATAAAAAAASPFLCFHDAGPAP